jgi:putative phosphoribosyl transferase
MSDVTQPVSQRRQVTIFAEGAVLPGELAVPPSPNGVVVFAHGSGSSRLSPRNAQVARVLNQGGLATLLFDLLTDAEAADRANVFDIPLLAQRLGAARDWLREQAETQALPVGYFGASTGAAAALWAAADEGADIRAIVSRGGRPDLAGPKLGLVHAPTLLVVGSADELVLELNRGALAELGTGEHELAIVPGATHLFEEPGALEQVAELTTAWFARHLTR